MSILFEPFKIKQLELRNRFVRSATGDCLADSNNQVTDAQIRFFADLAEGGVGLIITGITYVHNSGQLLSFQNSIAGDEFIEGFRKLTTAVHDRGAKIAMQLFHGGREAQFVKTRNQSPLAPSFVEDDAYFKGEYQELSDGD
ncbi:MAG: oxidoreductase, partial [Bacillota bacterium]